MMEIDYSKLDNPVWHSLSETHRKFSIGYPHVKFYHPDYCPFGGFIPAENISDQLEQYSALMNDFFIVGDRPQLSFRLGLKKELVCLQMIIKDKIATDARDNISKLTNEHAGALFELVNRVQPGYFKKKTALLGNYFGIFEKGQLISVTGERMKMNGFVEISAIVTHPDHTGKGNAKQLIAHAVNHIIDQNEIPYLHVVETNLRAIKLYEKLGFRVRRSMSFWNITN